LNECGIRPPGSALLNEPARREAGADANIPGEVGLVAVSRACGDLGQGSGVTCQHGQSALESQNPRHRRWGQADLMPEATLEMPSAPTDPGG
jgi:hypothetical protein